MRASVWMSIRVRSSESVVDLLIELRASEELIGAEGQSEKHLHPVSSAGSGQSTAFLEEANKVRSHRSEISRLIVDIVIVLDLC